MARVLAGRYELATLLGAGAMAQVYSAYDRELERSVAVKVLRGQVATQPDARERFLREARAAARLHHRNVVAVFDVGEDEGDPYLVMELVEGPTLADELRRRGTFSAPDALEVARPLLDALGAAHTQGLVHRDVKPANILLPPDAPLKLADFGIAKVLEADPDLTGTGQVLGTPRYLAPERISGAPATPASDVYAVGIVLYELLAGAPPFTASTPLAVAAAHQHDRVPPLSERRPDLDGGLVAVIDRALEKDPARRYPDAAEFREALSRPASGARTLVLTGPAPRRPVPRALLGALGLVAVAALGFVAAARSDGPPAPSPAPAPAVTPPPTPRATVADPPPTLEARDGTEELVERLEAVEQAGPNAPAAARELLAEVRAEAAAGELDPELAALAERVLAPIAAQPPDEPGDDDDDDDDPGRGKGKGKGRGKGRDD
jgi:tRNA A-37 threonylcarbamoyl transferase component Bud32